MSLFENYDLESCVSSDEHGYRWMKEGLREIDFLGHAGSFVALNQRQKNTCNVTRLIFLGVNFVYNTDKSVSHPATAPICSC